MNFRSHLLAGADQGGFGRSVTDGNGSFELAVPPVAGHLAIRAASDDYVLRVIGNREFFEGNAGGLRLYSHGFVACEAKPNTPVKEVRIVPRRGVTLTGRVVGPVNETIDNVWIICPSIFRTLPVAWSTWRGRFPRRGTPWNVRAAWSRSRERALDLFSRAEAQVSRPGRCFRQTGGGESAHGSPGTLRHGDSPGC